MLSKIQILLVIFSLLLTFYFVISWAAKVGKKSPIFYEIKTYLFGIRILISILAIISLILWLLM